MDIIMSVIICFLSVYGTFYLLYNLALSFNKKISTNYRYLHTVIGTDETAENIEEYVRRTSMQNNTNPLVIINYSQNNEYSQLLSILQSEFDFVNVFTPEEYTDYILSFNK